MVKDQALYKWYLFNIFHPFDGKLLPLIQEIPLKGMTPIDFQFTYSKVKVKLMIFTLSVVYLIYYNHLFDGYKTC